VLNESDRGNSNTGLDQPGEVLVSWRYCHRRGTVRKSLGDVAIVGVPAEFFTKFGLHMLIN